FLLRQTSVVSTATYLPPPNTPPNIARIICPTAIEVSVPETTRLRHTDVPIAFKFDARPHRARLRPAAARRLHGGEHRGLSRSDRRPSVRRRTKQPDLSCF